MKGLWGRRVLACAALLAAVAAVVAGGGSAGNRSGDPTFETFPGPGRVTFGENIAYRATFTNIGSSQFTHVIFRMRVPYADFGSPPFQEASPVTSTCPTTPVTVNTPNGPEWTCDFGKLDPGTLGEPQLVLTVVWKAPTIASTTNCDCLKTNGRWTVKEGVNDQADPNDAFPPGGRPQTATLLSAQSDTLDPNETKEAGGYESELEPCTNALGTGSLRTKPKLDPVLNPVSTTICLPSPIPSSDEDPGVATTIVESATHQHAGGHPSLGQSEVCIAALGTNCGGTIVAQDFSPALVTFVFRIHDGALPKGEKITQVFHNGFPLAPCPSSDPNGCVDSITLDKKTKIWTVVAKAPTNGYFDW